MLLNIPGSSLILNSSLMLSCFLCVTPSSDPYFPPWTDSSQTLYRDAPSLHPLCPRCQLQQYFYFPLDYQCLACQALELTWRGGSHHRWCQQRSQHLLMLPNIVVPALAHSGAQSVPAHHDTIPEGTRCICAHWTITGPSKCGLIWCLQLSFA